MITFFKANEERPDPASLVGKIVGKEGIKDFRSYSLPLLVTGHTGTRLHMKACVQNRDGILPVEEWSEDVNMLVRKVFYVCDTVEEATSIRAACARAQQMHDASRKALRLEIDDLFSSVTNPSAQADNE